MDTGTRVFAATGGLALVFVGVWAAVHNDGEDVRFSAGIGSAYSPSARRFWGIVVAVAGIVGATIALASLLR